jgi:hypothetical protein
MRLAYLLVADTVVIDQLTNRVRIFQIVDDVMVTGFPCVVPGWSAISGSTACCSAPRPTAG